MKTRATDRDLESRADAVLAPHLEAGGPGAAVAVLRDGRFALRKAYGLANLDWAVPLTPDAVFRICSLTKQFTAVAIMMLAERGGLDIDDPIERYLPDWPPRGRRITLRHLLSHTSGVWSHDTGLIERTLRSNPPLPAVRQLIFDRPFAFEPGERYSYNNSGYLLLGAVVEAVAGQTWDAFLHREVFEPLGMVHTGVLTHEAVTPRRAYGYVRGRKRFHNARLDAMNWSHAAGALGSTLDDLARWDRALRERRLIRRETLEAMLAPTPLNDGALYPYGFGWGLADYQGRRLFHHTGGMSGFACQMLHFREQDLTVIVLSNLYLFPFDQVTRGLIRAALDLGEVAVSPARLPEGDLVACAGAFKAEGVPVRTLEATAGALRFAEQGGPGLVPISPTEFRDAADPEIEYRFSDRSNGGWRRFDCLSPLWPPTTYRRAEG